MRGIFILKAERSKERFFATFTNFVSPFQDLRRQEPAADPAAGRDVPKPGGDAGVRIPLPIAGNRGDASGRQDHQRRRQGEAAASGIPAGSTR